MPNYTVKDGDCIESIAFEHGLFWEKVWNHQKNLNLKEKRKDPNVLFAGDVVFIPDKEEKQEPGATEQRHRFKRKGVPSRLHIRILENDKPRANEQYILEIDGKLFSDKTNANGELTHPIPPNAKGGKLLIANYEYPIQIGHLDPIEEIKGVQGRLRNLGFDCKSVDGVLNSETKEALRAFQKKHGLTDTGELDGATREKLKEIHGT